MKRIATCVAAVLSMAACSSKTTTTGQDGGVDMAGTGMVMTQLPPGVHIGTYIVLGDGLADGGGTGPFFYDQLHMDLDLKYPGLTYVHAAQINSITDTYSDMMPAGAPTLAQQIAGLASSYPGDVLITLSIGGIDLNSHSSLAILGIDDAVRAEFAAHLSAALTELLKPSRSSTGKVYLLETNIYDFSDGMGNFSKLNCGPAIDVQPANVARAFGAWNGVITNALIAAGGYQYDLYADFFNHGYNASPSDVWYAGGDMNSCLYPNATGHDRIRRMLYHAITGDTL